MTDWTQLQPLPDAREDAVVVANTQYVWALGGTDSAGDRQDTVWVALRLADGTLGAWTATTPLPEPLANAAGAVVRDNVGGTFVLVVGGDNGVAVNPHVYVAEMDGAGTLSAWWDAGVDLPVGRIGHALVLLSDEAQFQLFETQVPRPSPVWVLGGEVPGSLTDSVMRVELRALLGMESGSWVAEAVLPRPLAYMATAKLGRTLWLVGGEDSTDESSDVYQALLSGTSIEGWTEVESLPLPTSRARAAVLGEELYLVGGVRSGDVTDAVLRTLVVADGSLTSWVQASTLPEVRRSHGLFTHSGQLVVVGGSTGSDAIADVSAQQPPTFDSLVEETGGAQLAVWYMLDVALDGEVVHRYATTHFPGGDSYDARLLRLGRIQRGLGIDHYPQSSDVEVVLDNSDEGADWWVDRATVEDALRAKVRLYMGALRPEAPDVVQLRQLGEYQVSERPSRTRTEVRFSLTDLLGGMLSQTVRTPSVDDWRRADATCPLNGAGPAVKTEGLTRPLPLVLGAEVVSGLHCGRGVLVVGVESDGWDAGHHVRSVVALQGGKVKDLEPDSWTSTRSASFSFGERTWRVLYVQVQANVFGDYEIAGQLGQEWEVAGAESSMDWPEEYRLTAMWVPLTEENIAQSMSPADALELLVKRYSRGGAAYVDYDTLHRAPGGVCAGTVGDGVNLREAIAKLCASFDFDAFATRAGRLGVAARFLDYDSQTRDLEGLLELEEGELWDVEESYPSRQQRWALANRLFYVDGKRSPWSREVPSRLGPWDADTESDSPRHERDLSLAWQPWSAQLANPWEHRQVDAQSRPVLRFNTTLRALALDPGDYFRVTWTRGLADPYTAALFKLEEVDFDPMTMQVSVTAVWFDDTGEDVPFLLDDATLLRRCEGSGARTATVTQEDSLVTFSSGSLFTDGVEVGDHLILKDPTCPFGDFSRFRALRIEAVTGATELFLSSEDSFDFGTASTAVVTAWEIRRSHATAPATSQPHYPDGSSMYGRMTDAAGAYSDSVEPHRLK